MAGKLSHMPLTLTLDESTLFYWMLISNTYTGKKEKQLSEVSKWASAISTYTTTSSSHTKPTLQAPTRNSSHAKYSILSLTTSGTTGRSYAPSVLSDNVKIIGQQFSDVVIVKDEPAPVLSLYNDGGLSDNDEMKGEEREVAIKSPPKGKRQITSNITIFFLV